MNSSKSTNRSTRITLIFVIFIWLITGLAYLNRNNIYDWYRLLDYAPPADVERLADETTMNDRARRLFYVYRPSVESNDKFNEHCRDSEYTIVLGCYIKYQGIYLFMIDDPRLDGVEQVTAAHELLHAAYDRLSGTEKANIDGLTSSFFEQLQNQRIKDVIAQYQQKDPSSVPAELHSILGTEIRNLTPELEQYYARYFNDRSKVVSYSEQYETAFSSRRMQIERLEKELEDLKSQVDNANKNIDQQNTTLRERLRIIEGGMSASQQEIDDYNSKVRQYNALVNKASSLIDTYNSKYEVYKDIVGEQNELYSKIDSRPKTVQSQ